MALTYEPIASTTLSATANTVTISSIPATYDDLRIIVTGNSTAANTYMRLNGDSGNNYWFQDMYVNSSGTGGQYADAFPGVWMTWAAQWDGNQPAMAIIDIVGYTASLKKNIYTKFSGINATVNNYPVATNFTSWNNTNAINSILFHSGSGASNWQIGTRFTIFGIKAA